MKTRYDRNISTVQLSEHLVRSRARFMPAPGPNLPASPRPELRLGQRRHQPVQQKILVSFIAGAAQANPSICFARLFRQGLIGLLALVLGSALLGVTPARAQTQCPEATVKFVQPPNLDGGFDVWDSGPWVLADDFICTNTGPITDIHLWGSWLNNAFDPNTTFWLGMYDDVPAITNGPVLIPSHPGTNLIWQQWFGPGQYLQSFFSGDAGQMLDPGPPAIMGGESQAYYYCFYPTNPPVQQGTSAKPMMYWLAVYAQPSQGTANLFGWKTSTLHQFDISVHTQWPGGPPPATANWVPTTDPNNRPLDLAFKIVTSPNPPPPPCCPETNGVKWLQQPDVLHGMDVNASQNLVLADDFPCTKTGPVKDIRIWGSWLKDQVDANVVFTLGIWSDVPAVTNAANYVPSHPGVLLWTQPFGQGEYGQCLYTNVNEPFYDASLPANLGGDSKIYYLCFNPTNPFVQQGTAAAPTNYWLSVNARTTAGAGLLFGWHNSSDYYNDTAVWGNAPAPAAWNQMYDPTGIPLSLAFKVTTTTNQCPMTVTCAPDQSVQCGQPWTFTPPTVNSPCCGTAFTITEVDTKTNGNCPIQITRTWQVTDCKGNAATCSQTITVFNTTPPTIICPTNKTVECGSTWDFDKPTAYSACCTNVNVSVLNTYTNAQGPCYGYYTRVWVATDCCGNTNTCSQIVTVIDTQPPVLTCAPDKTVECGSVWNFDPPSAYDACCGTNVTLTPGSVTTNGTCPQKISHTWTATDCCGNRSVCTQTVTVVDTTPPTIVCPTNIIVQTCNTNIAVTWSVFAYDTCSPSVSVVSTPLSGSMFHRDTTNTVHVVATDACGNTNSCDFLVIVERPILDLSISRGAGTITLTWVGGGVLQQADNLLGPWSDIPLATSPWTISIVGPQKFYRVHCP